MHKIYIFDVDGTLTPSRRRMTEDFAKFFDKWSKDNIFYLVSGSDLEKMKEQVPKDILDLAEGLFTCGGNQFWVDGKLQYERQRPFRIRFYKVLGNRKKYKTIKIFRYYKR